jgi:hypothetical protein
LAYQLCHILRSAAYYNRKNTVIKNHRAFSGAEETGVFGLGAPNQTSPTSFIN